MELSTPLELQSPVLLNPNHQSRACVRMPGTGYVSGFHSTIPFTKSVASLGEERRPKTMTISGFSKMHDRLTRQELRLFGSRQFILFPFTQILAQQPRNARLRE